MVVLQWWTSEPIWTTAERAGLRTAQFLWARCDVPVNGITTQFCERFEKIPGKDIFEKNIKRALQKFDEGFQFVQVWYNRVMINGYIYLFPFFQIFMQRRYLLSLVRNSNCNDSVITFFFQSKRKIQYLEVSLS